MRAFASLLSSSCPVPETDGVSHSLQESVLAAQTKDKKRINDLETEVYIAWQSCLYVTNFPESFDKAALEQLFSKYGTIFDTRWPSKRFKNTRRFCYVQFANPVRLLFLPLSFCSPATRADSVLLSLLQAHAQAALELHGTELEPGHALSVLVSDPSRKKSRSDAGAHQRELYVASLARSVKEGDLRKLFEPFGTVTGVRIPQDDKGLCKGFAFVEFENDVRRALTSSSCSSRPSLMRSLARRRQRRRRSRSTTTSSRSAICRSRSPRRARPARASLRRSPSAASRPRTAACA